jgi:hypothetical protein
MTDISTRCGGNNSGKPFVAGELRGYRTWLRSHPDDVPAGMLPLRSVHLPYVSWTPTLRARCLAADYGHATKPHQVPAKGCRCGIYGWYRPRDRRIVPAPVFGVVAASGAIIMGTHGFRAQQATIVAIVSRDRDIAAACDRAGIVVYRRRRSLLRDYPTEDLTTLLGDHPGA